MYSLDVSQNRITFAFVCHQKCRMKIIAYISILLLLIACGPKAASNEDAVAVESEAPQPVPVNTDAMAMLAGVWIDEDTEIVLMRVAGDSIEYADSLVMPAHFEVRGDTLVVFGVQEMHYPIETLTNDRFYYQMLTRESVHLIRSQNDADTLAFCHNEPENITELHALQLERDSVMYAPSGKRYHLYVKVNPSLNKVYSTSYNEEGMPVRTAYYDNVVHIGMFDGARRVCSHDFRKDDFAEFVPDVFLESAVLYNIEFGEIDANGAHFQAVLSQPEGSATYVVDIIVSHEGKISIQAPE